jgi:hypothetical protein
MAIVNPTMPTPGQPRGGEETDLQNAVQAILNEFNGNIDSANLKDGGIALADLATAVLNNFLKLVVGADRKLAFRAEAPGAWGTVVQRDWTIAHGMGLTPIVAFAIEAPIATSLSGGVLIPVIVGLVSKDATNLTFRGRTGDGGTTNNANATYWMAIG